VEIDGLSGAVWNHDAFDNLVVPDDEKQLAWDFVESKTTSNEAFDDFIPDKGRGIIILMFGPPGVGKTFTAEAVAERANVPLYSMSASALGAEAAEIERNLDKALQVCKLWNAMLLLDEADVFLAARQSESIKRNELVSLFLTKLEYYPGILFLTTNRASDIDFAFQSRVDLFLPYYELTAAARLKIWSNFIDRAGRDGFSSANMEADLEKLSRLSLNGREIKNLVKTSQLLSQKAGGFGSMEKLYFLAEKRVRAMKLLAERGA
jgi:SpoVK/Ycf46/Vps4 family AAA+-type ATPase